MKKYKICLLGVKNTTQIIAEYLHKQGVQIDLIVSIDEEAAQKNSISDYTNLADTAKLTGAEYYCVRDYSLKKVKDNFFQENCFEIGIVYGWQRLIPEEIINVFSQGIFGFHASPELLPKGRGRSPLNWALILGHTKMYNHFFKYVKEADAGEIFSITEFSITAHDTILTLLYKSLVTAKTEIIKLLRQAEKGAIILFPQKGDDYFFPKRTPEDGRINFASLSTSNMVNLIRGVTRPFPGAFCYCGTDRKLIIWEAWEFDRMIDFSACQNGEVIDSIYNMPIVKTIDGSIILKEYEGPELKQGDILY